MSIIFDLGGVIVTWDPEAVVAEAFCDEDERRRVRRELLDHEDWSSLHKGALELGEAIARFAARTGLAASRIEDFMAQISAAPADMPEAVEMLRGLARDGHRLFCLSNMHRAVYESLLARGRFWDAFEGVVVSCLVGMMKPEIGIYRHALETFGLDARQTVFVDDTQENVDAAAACGIRGLLFTGVDHVRAQFAER